MYFTLGTREEEGRDAPVARFGHRETTPWWAVTTYMGPHILIWEY